MEIFHFKDEELILDLINSSRLRSEPCDVVCPVRAHC